MYTTSWTFHESHLQYRRKILTELLPRHNKISSYSQIPWKDSKNVEATEAVVASMEVSWKSSWRLPRTFAEKVEKSFRGITGVRMLYTAVTYAYT